MSTSDHGREPEDDAAAPAGADHADGPNPGPGPDAEQAPLGGSEPTEDDLEADNPVEEDTLKTLEGGAPTG